MLWSTAGVFVRMAALDTWTIVLWRSVFACVTLAVMALVRTPRGRRVRLTDAPGPHLASIGLTVVSSIAYVMSLRLTTVANVMTVYATLPFIATFIAYRWLHEKVTARFAVAGLMAFGAIAVMAGTVAGRQDLLGMFVALVMTVGFGTQLVLCKKHPYLNMAAITAIAAGLCVPLAAPLAHAGMPAPLSLLACALYGILTTGFAYVLAIEGGRRIRAGEAGLLSLLDVVLGPLWVWLLYAEQPSPTALVCGLVVLGAVTWYLLAERAAETPRVAA